MIHSRCRLRHSAHTSCLVSSGLGNKDRVISGSLSDPDDILAAPALRGPECVMPMGDLDMLEGDIKVFSSVEGEGVNLAAARMVQLSLATGIGTDEVVVMRPTKLDPETQSQLQDLSNRMAQHPCAWPNFASV